MAHTLNLAVSAAVTEADELSGGVITKCSTLATTFRQSTTKWENFRREQCHILGSNITNTDPYDMGQDVIDGKNINLYLGGCCIDVYRYTA
jgi:hypothetical protein